MGGWTWYTGSAAWFQKVIVDWILGIRATPEGLIIDPCIPKEWDKFSVKRTFRGTVYNINIFNEDHVSSGIKYILIDGNKTEKNLLNIKDKTRADVEVFMGNF
jgi:cellobiose phosphorylase